ncbi:zinc-dependent metalloprotease family protein [Luteolibacter sp. LG18]|uniref:Ig-like domain-containing protein n=1 Tax=Luteolibacter sp. LG18 TaxID=2819286 RepID=UPI002B287BBE|nr:hypothetical protein llg_14500 [Luteolibacter sp. LG18]
MTQTLAPCHGRSTRGALRHAVSTTRLLAAPAGLLLGLSSLAGAQAPPSTLTKTYTYTGGSLTVNYSLHDVRGPNFGVYSQAAGGAYTAHTPSRPNRTYLGTVTGYPGAIAAAQLRDDGSLRTSIIFEDGTTWRGTTLSMTIPAAASWTPIYPTTVAPAGGAGSSVYAADVALDLTPSYYTATGSNVDNALEMAEYCLIETDAVYLRDAAIKMQLGRVIVRTSTADDPYAGSSDLSVLLPGMRDHWNNVLSTALPATSYDLAALVRPGAGGGLAYVGVIGTSSRYGANGANSDGNFTVIWRHEAGHNWGSSHYEGGGKPEGPTIMSDNALSRFSSSELAKIIAHRNTKTGILTNLGGYTYPLPPRANADRATVDASRTPITLDVMANDSDSNGQSITIPSFDTASNKGGTITRSVGTGPGGRDQLIYTAPSSFTSGLDWFSYRIKDSANYEAKGWVMVNPAPQPAAPWVSADIGSVGTVGGTSFDGTTYTLMGSGADIWSTADAFRYVYQPMTGDGEIVARVASSTSSQARGKSGVMIRETLTAGSKHVSTLFHSDIAKNVTTRRTTTGGSSTEVNGATAATPTWVKLTRTGDTFVSATSTDGTTWTTVSTTTVSMASSVYVGLAVSALNNSSTRTTGFDNVTVTP